VCVCVCVCVSLRISCYHFNGEQKLLVKTRQQDTIFSSKKESQRSTSQLPVCIKYSMRDLICDRKLLPTTLHCESQSVTDVSEYSGRRGRTFSGATPYIQRESVVSRYGAIATSPRRLVITAHYTTMNALGSMASLQRHQLRQNITGHGRGEFQRFTRKYFSLRHVFTRQVHAYKQAPVNCATQAIIGDAFPIYNHSRIAMAPFDAGRHYGAEPDNNRYNYTASQT